MKKLSTVAAVLATLAFSSGAAQAASTYTADKAHSSVGFSVRHMMTQVRGTFGDFSGTIVKDDANLAGASVEFKIQATSVDTANEMRDKHLRTEDFFFVEKFPEITFKSTKIEKVSDTEYKATGEFTMRGVTKVLTLPVTFLGEMKGMDGKPLAGFSVTTKLDRKEFGINWNKTLDAGGLLLSDEVTVEISIEAKQSS
ncbi:MAG: YceI family protein [Thermoanaerobaculia bacterium]|nr:YceI family protein [Thermoanaerobaculia bacterium]